MLEYERDFGHRPAPQVQVNISNHPATGWTEDQINACNLPAGELPHYIPFPNIPPEMLTGEVIELAGDIADQIAEMDLPAHSRVMVQGEMTLTFALVSYLKKMRLVPVAATTERETVENQDGTKTSRFRFVQFREY